MENLNTAFDVAEKYLDIPRMLDPDGKLAHLYILIRSTEFFVSNFYSNIKYSYHLCWVQ